MAKSEQADSAAFASGSATLYLGSHHATRRWWALGIPLRGRHEPGCSPSHKSEANCPRFAMRWRDNLLTEEIAA